MAYPSNRDREVEETNDVELASDPAVEGTSTSSCPPESVTQPAHDEPTHDEEPPSSDRPKMLETCGSTMAESDFDEESQQQERRGSSASHRSSFTTSIIDPPEEGLSRSTLTTIVINYVSAGFLLLPYAFAKAGTLLSSVVFGLVALQSFVTSSFVLGACARAEALANVITFDSGERGLPTKKNAKRYSMSIRSRKFELPQLTRIFLGKWPTCFFMVTLMGDLYGITWLFAAVFGSTLSDILPFASGDDDYKTYVLLFMAITAPLTCVPIIDQLSIQLVFLISRLLMVVLMLATVAVGYVSDEPQFGTQIGAVRDVPLADFSNLILIVQTAIFSTAFQFAVPVTASISRNKKSVQPVIKTGVKFIFISNLILALVLSIFFGQENMQDSSNRMWETYHSADEGCCPHWASFIRGYIVMFAAIDSLAVFPLISVSLSEILMDFFYHEKVHEIKVSWKRRTFFRLLASVPQVVGALFVKELDILAIYGGIFTILSYTVCPSVLHIASQRRMQKEDLPVSTHYDTVFSSNVLAWTLIFAGCGIIICICAGSVS